MGPGGREDKHVATSVDQKVEGSNPRRDFDLFFFLSFSCELFGSVLFITDINDQLLRHKCTL